MSKLENNANDENSVYLPMEEKVQCHVQVDRRRLEALLLTQLNDCAGGQTNAAERFFCAVENEVPGVRVAWPQRLKIGAKSKKDPHVKIVGTSMNDVNTAKQLITDALGIMCDRITLKMRIDRNDHASIIGRGGAQTRALMEKSGCRIHFPDGAVSNATAGGAKTLNCDLVSMSGTLRQVECARRSLRALTPIVLDVVCATVAASPSFDVDDDGGSEAAHRLAYALRHRLQRADSLMREKDGSRKRSDTSVSIRIVGVFVEPATKAEHAKCIVRIRVLTSFIDSTHFNAAAIVAEGRLVEAAVRVADLSTTLSAASSVSCRYRVEYPARLLLTAAADNAGDEVFIGMDDALRRWLCARTGANVFQVSAAEGSIDAVLPMWRMESGRSPNDVLRARRLFMSFLPVSVHFRWGCQNVGGAWMPTPENVAETQQRFGGDTTSLLRISVTLRHRRRLATPKGVANEEYTITIRGVEATLVPNIYACASSIIFGGDTVTTNANGGRESEIDNSFANNCDDQWGDLFALCKFLGVNSRQPADVSQPFCQLAPSSQFQFVGSPQMITFFDNYMPSYQPILLMPTAMVSGNFSGYSTVPQWPIGPNNPTFIPQHMPISPAPSFVSYWSPIPASHSYMASPPPPPPSMMFPVSTMMHRQPCSSHGQYQRRVGESRPTVNLSNPIVGSKKQSDASKNNGSPKMENRENGKGQSTEEILATICSDSPELGHSTATSVEIVGSQSVERESRYFKQKLPASLELKPSFPAASKFKPMEVPCSPDPDESPIAHSLLAGALSIDFWQTNTKSLWPSRVDLGAVTGFSNSMPAMASIWAAGADDAVLLDSDEDVNTSIGSSSDEENDAVVKRNAENNVSLGRWPEKTLKMRPSAFHTSISGIGVRSLASVREEEEGAAAISPRSGDSDALKEKFRELEEILHRLDCEEYVPMFQKEEVDGEAFLLLDEESLREIGVHSPTTRRKIFRAICELRKRF